VDRWHLIDGIFHEALQRDPTERDAFVREACRGDSELHRDVSSLLAHHDEAGEDEPWAAVAAARLIDRQRALEPGTALGPYRIECFLAAGGMGEVYRARDTRLDRIVAIKVLSAELVSDPQFRERFDREARVISRLEHPHICTLYDVGEQAPSTASGPTVAYLVMQYLEGETLEQRLKHGALPFEQALRYAVQMADALAKAHRAGIVHRDLKPGNIMLTQTGATLLDFGLAKATGVVAAAAGGSPPPTTTPGLTAQGTILGTFQYMTPEQLEGHEADVRTDIFAFGAVVHEMVTGKKAFTANSHATLIAAILKDDPLPLSSVQPLASPLVDHIVRRCLAKDPDERWQAASDVMRELEWTAETVPRPASDAASAGHSFRWWPALSLGLIALVAAVALIARFGRWTPAASDPLTFAIAPPDGATLVTPAGPLGEPWLALSPDGRVLAFVAVSADGRQQLWLRTLAMANAYPLAGTDGAQAPFWSPDSRSLAFFARGKLKVVDAAGGTPQVVADAPGYFGSGSWNRENTIVFAPTPRNEGLRSVQVGPPHASQMVTRVDHGRGQRGHFLPQFLPDGRHFLFGVGGALGGGEAETWVGSLDGGEPRLLLRADSVGHYAEPGYLLFKRGSLFSQRMDGRGLQLVGDPVPLAGPQVGSSAVVPYLALSTSMTGTLAYGALAYGAARGEDTRLMLRDRSGRLLGSIDVTGASAPSFSRDGTMLAVSRTLPETGADLWLYDVKRRMPMRFTFDSASTRSGVWSPDGKAIVFTASRNGTLGRLYSRPTSGSGSDELLSNVDGATPTDWSHDGRYILFHTNNNLDQGILDQRNGYDLWVLSLADHQSRPLVRTPFHEIHGVLSPDGRWLAYASDESGAFEVYVQAFAGGQGKRLVSKGGGTEPHWRADGRELFYVSADRRLSVVPTTIGPAFEAGTPATLFEVNVRELVLTSNKRYDVTPDGQRFVVVELTGRVSPSALTVVVNWSALLPPER
jgi:serine/threonine protein kinase/Tol biopolymer transport system component